MGPRLSVKRYPERNLLVLMSLAHFASAKPVSWRLWSVPSPPQRQAHVDSAMEVSKDLLDGVHVNLRGIGMGGAKNAQRSGNTMTRA
jgi:hypothetical protein